MKNEQEAGTLGLRLSGREALGSIPGWYQRERKTEKVNLAGDLAQRHTSLPGKGKLPL